MRRAALFVLPLLAALGVDWWYGVLLRRNPLPLRLRAAPQA
jgi:hypothetical protein